MDVMNKCEGNKFVSMATYPVPDPIPTQFVMPRIMFHYISSSIVTWIKSKTRSIGYKLIWGGTLRNNEVGPAVWVDFLPEALEKGVFIPAPDPRIVGKGLDNIPAALDLLKKGVSAKKLVVSL
jgi:hypothetical protein